ncbi:unnamed protein product [Cyprideis torosa]|uniref:Uncharacterized protein n=1 Tax=Cyprideis torosa TaxID=163714 RepID=A0A7R8W566_9CRUS|nr:unnamed protein product [Cyprideis torosa]CAG0881380.1 unnamed protein product [Cyprideis torosa]
MLVRILCCYSFVAFPLLVHGRVDVELRPSSPDHPDECYLKEYKRSLKYGEQWQVPGRCWIVSCQGNATLPSGEEGFSFLLGRCDDDILPLLSCRVDSGDPVQPFPGCCPTFICPAIIDAPKHPWINLKDLSSVHPGKPSRFDEQVEDEGFGTMEDLHSMFSDEDNLVDRDGLKDSNNPELPPLIILENNFKDLIPYLQNPFLSEETKEEEETNSEDEEDPNAEIVEENRQIDSENEEKVKEQNEGDDTEGDDNSDPKIEEEGVETKGAEEEGVGSGEEPIQDNDEEGEKDKRSKEEEVRARFEEGRPAPIQLDHTKS